MEGNKIGLNYFFFYSVIIIFLFYVFGLMYINYIFISVVEYWCWWVVYFWVEGFFEVFVMVAIVYLCSELGFLKCFVVLCVIYLIIILYLGSGVIGIFYYFYFVGILVFIVVMGVVVFVLEVVFLILIGFEVVKFFKFF